MRASFLTLNVCAQVHPDAGELIAVRYQFCSLWSEELLQEIELFPEQAVQPRGGEAEIGAASR